MAVGERRTHCPCISWHGGDYWLRRSAELNQYQAGGILINVGQPKSRSNTSTLSLSARGVFVVAVLSFAPVPTTAGVFDVTIEGALDVAANEIATPLSDTAAEASGLYRINSINNDGTTPTSWLFGTLHVDDAAVLARIDPMIPILDEVDRVILEVDLDALRSHDFRRQLFLPKGASLRDIIGSELFERTLVAVESRGIDANQLDRYRPFAAIQTLSVPRRSSGLFLDEKIRRLAVVRGKEIVGIETLEEQIDIVDGMTLTDQTALLAHSIDSIDQFDSDVNELISLYVRGDLDELLKAARRQMVPDNPQLKARLEHRLLSLRNQVMVDRLLPLIGSTSNFIAVGAAHLPGTDGIIALMRENGYEVRAAQVSN